jgi:hypothetical protein
MFHDLVRFLRLSGLVQQSLDALAPDIPRWERRLRGLGYRTVPDLCRSSRWTTEEIAAGNLINLMLLEAVPVATRRQIALAHELRDFTRTR